MGELCHTLHHVDRWRFLSKHTTRVSTSPRGRVGGERGERLIAPRRRADDATRLPEIWKLVSW